MPLRNRLEEVIQRYEKAAQALKSYKDGRLSEDELGNTFTNLRKERKAVDENNRNYIKEQRRIFLGPKAAAELEKQEEEEHQVDDVDEDSYEDSYEDEEEEEDEEEDEEEEEEEAAEEEDAKEEQDGQDGSNDTGVDEEIDGVPTKSIRGRREKKLWKQYGPLWEAL